MKFQETLEGIKYLEGKKLKKSEIIEIPRTEYVIADVSVFLLKDRFYFLKRLLNEILQPKMLIISSDLYYTFRNLIEFGKYTEDELRFLKVIIEYWEPFRRREVLTWLSSLEFKEIIKEFMMKWGVTPAKEFVRYKQQSNNPIKFQEIKEEVRRVVWEELEAAIKLKAFIVSFTNRLITICQRAEVMIMRVHSKAKDEVKRRLGMLGRVLLLILVFNTPIDLFKQSLESAIPHPLGKLVSDATIGISILVLNGK